jgi:prepilin-type N-terminal cleavage/methylation domain-containing protein
MKTQTNRTARPRSAFTLLELVIVIAIIGMLSSLLFFGIGGALRGVAVTEVKAEFTQLETAMTTFESDYGVIPPSRIVLTENPGATAWDPVSKSVLRKMFGSNVDFTTLVDFNGDNDKTDVLTLTSSECLLFFLGGMRNLDDEDTNNNGILDAGEDTNNNGIIDPIIGKTLTGFSANREKPFARGGDNRTGPQFTFDSGRFIDLDGDGMPEYRDLATDGDVATVFASSNNGQGYDKLGEDKNSNNVLDAGEDTNGNGVLEGAVAHYHQSDGTTAWNENSFQLISPGEDGKFGFDVAPNPFVAQTWSPGSTVTGEQADNISNFAPNTMGQQ